MLDQWEDFQDRLSRIRDGAAQRFDPTTGLPRQRLSLMDRLWRVICHTAFAASFVLAPILGAAGLILARYVRDHHYGLPLPGFDPTMDTLINLGAGWIFGVMWVSVFNMRRWGHMLMMSIGVLIMTASFHNLVHLTPRPFVTAFSADWVASMQARTVPGTLLWRGTFYSLHGAAF
jgi:hypothetical protein